MAKAKKTAALTVEERLEQALVPEGEQHYQVPENWCWTKLPNLVSIKTGKKDANYSTENGKYLFFTCAAEPLKCDDFSFEGETILVAGNGANVGLCIYYNGKCEVYQRTYVLQKKCNMMLKYIYYHFNCFWKDYNGDKQYGSATNYIKLGNFENYLVCVPPLAEQQRIVDRIESLFAKLDEVKEKAQAALDSFETRRAAILHKAFTGELTAKWRKENGVGMDSWSHGALSTFCKSLKYGTANKSKEQGKVVVIRMGNLQQGEIDWTNLAFSDDEDDIKKYLLTYGDVLFNRTNSPELVGKTSIYRGQYPAIYAGYLIKLDYGERLVGEFLNYIMNSSYAKEYCSTVKTDGVNQSNINAKKIGAFVIPVPSIPEQTEIVQILNNFLAKEQKAKELCSVIDNIDLIKKSILARAFRGELGTNDPTEESAVELLKSIV